MDDPSPSLSPDTTSCVSPASFGGSDGTTSPTPIDSSHPVITESDADQKRADVLKDTGNKLFSGSWVILGFFLPFNDLNHGLVLFCADGRYQAALNAYSAAITCRPTAVLYCAFASFKFIAPPTPSLPVPLSHCSKPSVCSPKMRKLRLGHCRRRRGPPIRSRVYQGELPKRGCADGPRKVSPR